MTACVAPGAVSGPSPGERPREKHGGILRIGVFWLWAAACLAGPWCMAADLVPEALVTASRDGEAALVVDKSLQRLVVYRFEQGEFKWQAAFTVTTGQNDRNKVAEGDLGTPEGIYFPVSFLDQGELLPEYGVGAFPLDYPNFFDRLEGKTGSGIWIHAADDPLRFLTRNVTRGCVVLSNRSFEELAGAIRPRETAVVIDNEIRMVEPAEAEESRRELAGFIEGWRSAWEQGDIDRYLSAYHADFVRRQGEPWLEKKTRLLSSPERPVVRVWRPSIYRWRDRVVARFYQHYRFGRLDTVGLKVLYLQRYEGEYKIVEEELLGLGSAPAPVPVDVLEALRGTPGAREETTAALSREPLPDAIPANPLLVRPATEGLGPVPETPALRAGELTLTQNGDVLEARFRLERWPQDGRASSGRLFVFAVQPGGGTVSFPPAELCQGKPSRPEVGDWYSIRRFKIVEARLPVPAGAPAPRSIRVIAFDTSGHQVLEQEISR